MPSDPSVPPEYSPKVFPPLYTPSPQSSESTLQRSSTAGPSRIAASGYFVGRQDGITLLLHNQDGSAARPSIGPGAFLEGRVILELTDRDTVRAVQVNIEGWIESLPLPGAHSSVSVVSISKVLYSSDTGTSCPNSLPFSHRFPSIFNEGESVYLLPPTCQIQFNNTPFFMKCTYRITATVVAQKHVFRKEHRICVDLDYHPQVTPFQPMPEHLSLLKTIKQCPEEWTQLPTSTLKQEVLCDFFVPRSKTFSTSEAIPFYLQLLGSTASLREIFSGGCGAFKHPLHSADGTPIQVYLLRRVTMRVGERNARRSIVLGEATKHERPPIFRDQDTRQTNEVLAWEGELRCRDGGNVGSFEAGLVSVRDSIVAEVSPPMGTSLGRMFVEHTIRLTADGWR